MTASEVAGPEPEPGSVEELALLEQTDNGPRDDDPAQDVSQEPGVPA